MAPGPETAAGRAANRRGSTTGDAFGGRRERAMNQAMPTNSRTLAKTALVMTMTMSWFIYSPPGVEAELARTRTKNASTGTFECPSTSTAADRTKRLDSTPNGARRRQPSDQTGQAEPEPAGRPVSSGS